MRKQNAANLVLDSIHCRAICDEIGERLRSIMKPTTSDVPPRLLDLIRRLAVLEQCDLLRVESAPSIVPTSGEMPLLTAGMTGADQAGSLVRR
jgi:hypothetical protein